MKFNHLLGLFTGLIIVFAVFAWVGIAPVISILTETGWPILIVCVFFVPEILLGTEAWRRLFPADRRPRFSTTALATWIGSSINTFLPVAGIGGEIVKARLLGKWAGDASIAYSTTIVDKTVQAIALLLSGLIGILALTLLISNPVIIWSAAAGALLLALGIAGFIAVQLAGSVAWLAKWTNWGPLKRLQSLQDHAENMDNEIAEMYRRPGALGVSTLLRLAGRLLLFGEVMVVGHLIGVDIGWLEALMITTLVVGLRGISFFIPAGLGIQEVGFVLVGSLMGYSGETMLTISLAARVRETLPDLPAFLWWQQIEGRAVWARRTGSS